MVLATLRHCLHALIPELKSLGCLGWAYRVEKVGAGIRDLDLGRKVLGVGRIRSPRLLSADLKKKE